VEYYKEPGKLLLYHCACAPDSHHKRFLFFSRLNHTYIFVILEVILFSLFVPLLTLREKYWVTLERSTLCMNELVIFTTLTASFSASTPTSIGVFPLLPLRSTVHLCLRKGKQQPNPSATQKAINELQ
jgi:hypothetical protein